MSIHESSQKFLEWRQWASASNRTLPMCSFNFRPIVLPKIWSLMMLLLLWHHSVSLRQSKLKTGWTSTAHEALTTCKFQLQIYCISGDMVKLSGDYSGQTLTKQETSRLWKFMRMLSKTFVCNSVITGYTIVILILMLYCQRTTMNTTQMWRVEFWPVAYTRSGILSHGTLLCLCGSCQSII